MRPRRHLDLQRMFHLPFISTFIFVSLACSGGVPVTFSRVALVVFRQKLFLNANAFRTTRRNATNVKLPAGCPEASKQHICIA